MEVMAMENVLGSLAEPKTEAEYEAPVDLLLQELRSHQQRMDQDRLEIDRLKAETRAVAERTDTVLASISKHLEGLHKTG
jgi:hypothetical protein